MPKHVIIRCYDPIARHKFARQPWSDVWLSFTAKPGRKKYRFAPTLVSKVALEGDLRSAREQQAKEAASDYAREIEIAENVLTFFANGGDYFVDAKSSDKYTPTIYTSRPYIDRAEAEVMLRKFMRTLGYLDVTYKWLKPKFLMIPVQL
ncbi:MAG: hypothetical protein LC803_15075 [Acidobacteria bacterium]|nr:hypothetical protein [Acidobacteriota bacterium]